MVIVSVAWTGITIMYCLHVAQQTSRQGMVLSVFGHTNAILLQMEIAVTVMIILLMLMSKYASHIYGKLKYVILFDN